MRFVLVTTEDQQAQALVLVLVLVLVLNVRATLIEQCTQLINTLRGHAAQCGMIASKVVASLAAIEAGVSIPPVGKEMLALLGQQIEHLDGQIKHLDAKLAAMHKPNASSQLLATAPGICPVIALSFALGIDPAAFESGPHLAAWLGLTPKEHSTGGKHRMGGISKAGHERLRAL